MNEKDFDDKMELIYKAIRHTYKYDDIADELIDFVIDATEDYRRKLH